MLDKTAILKIVIKIIFHRYIIENKIFFMDSFLQKLLL